MEYTGRSLKSNISALIYASKHSFHNRVRRALKKPITYIYVVLGVLYIGMVLYGWAILAKKGGIGTEKWMIYVLTVWMYMTVFSNFITYAKRKGVIFKPEHSHFIFPAPLSPKVILLYGALKNFWINLIIDVVLALVGITVFHLSVWKALLMFLIIFVCETAFEASLVVFLYAKEEKYDLLVKVICKGIYVVLGGIALTALIYLKRHGFSLHSIAGIFDLPALQMIPFAGWSIAAFRMVILGPDLLNVVCTVLYLVSCAAMVIVAIRMKCTGSYYEDAAKFADDYAEVKNRSKNGEMVFSIGKKRKFKKAKMRYKGTGAKAVFYRQMLEYRKEKYFIFGAMTVYSVMGAVICIAFIGKPEKFPPGLYLLGVMAYLIFLTTGYLGKWNKELVNPYIYLIPDTSARKLWYATLMEHIKALADGMVLAVPVGIAWRIPIFQIIMCILIYCVLQANRLYIKILGESILGNVLGRTGKSLFSLAVQAAIIGTGIGAAALFGFLLNYNLVFPIMLIYSMIITVLIAFITAGRFDTMEQWD